MGLICFPVLFHHLHGLQSSLVTHILGSLDTLTQTILGFTEDRIVLGSSAGCCNDLDSSCLLTFDRCFPLQLMPLFLQPLFTGHIVGTGCFPVSGLVCRIQCTAFLYSLIDLVTVFSHTVDTHGA